MKKWFKRWFKPLPWDNKKPYYCPNCGAFISELLINDEAKYCDKCGERTDFYPLGSYHKCGETLP